MCAKQIKRLLIVVVCIVAVIVCATIVDKNAGQYTGGNKAEGGASISLKEIGEVSLVNEVISTWLENPGDVHSVEDLYEQYRQFGRLDYPNPVNIEFFVKGLPEGAKIIKQEISISEDEGFSETICVEVPQYKNSTSIYNLKSGTTYYYKVTVSVSDGSTIDQLGTFMTRKSPRYIYVDGIRNVRDIGGVQTKEGKTIKQGMIYRGTEMDGAISEGKFVITERGIDTMVNELKIKHQMDLRASNLENSKDMLPSSISHKYYTAFSYSETFDSHGVKSLKKIFADLANPDNYPMYMHCTYGNDRTGTIVYLMEAVLGVDEKSLYTEWALSSFFSGSNFANEMDIFIDTLQSYEGSDMQDKVSNYLISIGVTQEQLDNFRSIMLAS